MLERAQAGPRTLCAFRLVTFHALLTSQGIRFFAVVVAAGADSGTACAACSFCGDSALPLPLKSACGLYCLSIAALLASPGARRAAATCAAPAKRVWLAAASAASLFLGVFSSVRDNPFLVEASQVLPPWL